MDFPEIKNRTKSNLLVIAGSDKRGTIYGLFHLSEMLGVSPFVDWCGLMPPKQEKIELREDMACISKEPSVRYRGFLLMMNGRHLETGAIIILAALMQKLMIMYLNFYSD